MTTGTTMPTGTTMKVWHLILALSLGVLTSAGSCGGEDALVHCAAKCDDLCVKLSEMYNYTAMQKHDCETGCFKESCAPRDGGLR